MLNTSQQSYTLPKDENTTIDVGEVSMIKDKTYYITYNVDTATTSSSRNTARMNLVGDNNKNLGWYQQSAASDYNLTTGRKTWIFTAPATRNCKNEVLVSKCRC